MSKSREELLEELVKFQDDLLATYRIGGRAKGKTLDGISRLKRQLFGL